MSFIRVNDIQLAYTDAGLGLPVVLLHGYPFNRTLWNEQVNALSNSYRVITPDLRGFGDSAVAPDGCYDPATLARLEAGGLLTTEECLLDEKVQTLAERLLVDRER